MTRVTEGHLARHYQGVRGGRDAALLDIAQDHVLYLLHQAGAFDAGLVFKGGTALRKFRAGSAGRFSTDLDFAAPSEELALSVLAALDGVEIDGFSFAISNLGDDGRRGDLVVETPFGHPQLGAKVELARHALSLPADLLSPIAMPIHDRYAFSVPPTPVVRVEEAIAEKLARYRRVSLARDPPRAASSCPYRPRRAPPARRFPDVENGWFPPPGQDPAKTPYTTKCGAPQPPSQPAKTACAQTWCLFNVTADPCEYFDVAAAHPDVVASLVARLATFSATAVPPEAGSGCATKKVAVGESYSFVPCDWQPEVKQT